MDIILIKLWAFLRPITAVEIDIQILGLNFFELVGITFIAVLWMAILLRSSVSQKYYLSEIDIVILLYAFWVIAGAVIYPDKTDIADLVRWLTPLLTWFAVRNIIVTRENYITTCKYMFYGYIITIIANALAILILPQTITVEFVPSSTNLSLYKGLYYSSANLGLSVAMLFIMGGSILVLDDNRAVYRKSMQKVAYTVFLIVVSVASIYCLIKSQSRTAMIGILVFVSVYLLYKSRKYFLFISLIVVIAVSVSLPVWRLIFHDVVEVIEGERPLERIGSGRPYIWMHNLTEFSKLSMDRKLIGAGIGNQVRMFTWNQNSGESIWSSHNDYLRVLLHTGLVGLSIFIILHLAILRRILVLRKDQRWILLAAFISIAFMTFSTNSFVARIALGQAFYLLFVFVLFGEKKRKSDKYVNHIRAQ